MYKIDKSRIVPVVVIEDAKNAVPLVRAMKKGGIPIAEITMRTPVALDAISKISESQEEVLVGAGSVMNIEQAEMAISAGAKFIVSPGFDYSLVEYCISRKIEVFPGCVTPSEIMAAVSLGLHTVKFFPSNIYGGISGMKALSGPFPQISFIPTGGINAENLREYLNESFIKAVGGSWLCSKKDISEGNYDRITKLCEEAIKIANATKKD